jgi:hypothetical protein
VVDIGGDGKAHKCTLCYDRLQHGMEPACAQACPTDSIRFGDVGELRTLADQRVADLQAAGVPAYVYGKEDIVGGLNCFFLLVDKPEVYGLPSRPELPSTHVDEGFTISALAAAAVAVGSVVSFRKDRMDGMGRDPAPEPAPPDSPPSGETRPPGADTVAFMHAIHAANDASRGRRAAPATEAGAACGTGGCGGTCGCHA